MYLTAPEACGLEQKAKHTKPAPDETVSSVLDTGLALYRARNQNHLADDTVPSSATSKSLDTERRKKKKKKRQNYDSARN